MIEDSGREIWDMQKEFNDKFFATKGGWPKEDTLVALSKEFCLHLIKEATEVLDEMHFKMHRTKSKEMDPMNVLEEMVDVQKFLWGWMQVHGFTYDDFLLEFKRKSSVVEQRFAQERSMKELESHPCVLVDIDGVLADWEGGFAQWLTSTRVAGVFTCPTAAWAWYENEAGVLKQEAVKRAFRQSGKKAELDVLPGAKELLQLIRSKSSLKIVLLTNRPYDENFRIYPDTLTWIKKNDLPYDAIIWSRDKGFDAVKTFRNVYWAVDDKDKNVKRLREAKITTIHVNPCDPETNTQALFEFALQHLQTKGGKLDDLGYVWNRHVAFEKMLKAGV